MTSSSTLNTGISSAKELIGSFYNDAWRSTSLLINILGKIERYCQSLGEQHPEDGYYGAEVVTSGAISMMNATYSCPIDDERFADVDKMYEATVVTFIDKLSDDAMYDLIYLGSLANFIAGMRVHSINNWIEETSPSEEKFQALKLAKRDEAATDAAVGVLQKVLLSLVDGEDS